MTQKGSQEREKNLMYIGQIENKYQDRIFILQYIF